MIHMTNWVINGLPERFPNLKVMWIESGLAWVPFVMQRLDNEYMMRTSDARCSNASRASTCGRCTTPPSRSSAATRKAHEATFETINANNQLLYASD